MLSLWWPGFSSGQGTSCKPCDIVKKKKQTEKDLGITTAMKWQEIPCPVSRLTIESEVVDLRLSLWMVGTTNSLANGTSCLHPRYSLANPWCHLEAASTK